MPQTYRPNIRTHPLDAPLEEPITAATWTDIVLFAVVGASAVCSVCGAIIALYVLLM